MHPGLPAYGVAAEEASRLLLKTSEMTISFVEYLMKRAEIQHVVVSCQVSQINASDTFS